VSGFERRHQIRFPGDFRWWLQNGPAVRLHFRAFHDHDGNLLSEIDGWKLLRPQIDSPHISDFWWVEQQLGSEAPAALMTWMSKLIPIMSCENGHDVVHCDFAFDAENPPLVLVRGEYSGLRDMLAYVAPSLIDYLELQRCPVSEFAPNELLEALPVPELSEFGLAWNAHRDRILASSRATPADNAGRALNLDSLIDVVDMIRMQLEALGCTVLVGRSGRPKSAIWLSAAGPDAEGQLTIWDSGEGELVYGSESGQEHHSNLADLTQRWPRPLSLTSYGL